MISNCNCSEKLTCGCTVSFDQYSNNTISVLSVGNLTGGSCTFDEYVIDWYLNGEIALVSGKGNHPEITAFHPFTGNAAIPVRAGTYAPVIRYVVINGVRVFPTPGKCRKWCPDLTGLPSITVQSISCSTVGGNPPANYSYKIYYDTTLDYAQAERTVVFMLPADKSALYFAVWFYAYEVADRIEVFFGEETTPLASWIVGLLGHNTQRDSMPYDWAGYDIQFMVKLPEYAQGDYLRIEVTPSVLQSTVNTKWWAAFACITEDFTNECDDWTLAMRTWDISNFRLTNDAANCRWLFQATYNTPLPDYSTYILNKYVGIGGISYQQAQYNSTGKVFSIALNYGRKANNAWYKSQSGFTTIAGTIQVVKTGNTFTFTFSDNADRDVFYNRWQSILATAWDDGYDPLTPTVYSYYRFFALSMQYTQLACGDTYTSGYYVFHIGSTVTFGTNTMTIAAAGITNQITAVDCDSAYTSLNTTIANANNTFSLADFNQTTVCRPTNPFDAWKCGYTDYFTSSNFGGFAHYMKTDRVVPCNMPYWCLVNGYYVFMIAYLRVTITNNNDPANNYKVESGLNLETGCVSGYVRIYEKQNGIQIYPV